MKTKCLLFLFLASLLGCSQQVFECGACTLEFRTIGIEVIDTQGNPVTGVSITIQNEQTGNKIVNPMDYEPEDHYYPILDDGYTDSINIKGDSFIVKGQKGNASFQERFVIGADNCRCHITKISGPDRVILQ